MIYTYCTIQYAQDGSVTYCYEYDLNDYDAIPLRYVGLPVYQQKFEAIFMPSWIPDTHKYAILNEFLQSHWRKYHRHRLSATHCHACKQLKRTCYC
jgi:hypothetical protein